MSVSALLLAVAALLAAGPARVRNRIGLLIRKTTRSPVRHGVRDPFAMASALDVMSVCLSGGMTVPAAAVATAACAPPGLAAMLTRAAGLLALGAHPDTAWRLADGDDECAALARLARRSACSGSALAQGIADLAEQQRRDANHAATAAAERAGVLIAGPLGLCFLPAFVCVGIIPVVAGLAGEVFGAALR